jgi:hypothetical protein
MKEMKLFLKQKKSIFYCFLQFFTLFYIFSIKSNHIYANLMKKTLKIIKIHKNIHFFCSKNVQNISKMINLKGKKSFFASKNVQKRVQIRDISIK